MPDSPAATVTVNASDSDLVPRHPGPRPGDSEPGLEWRAKATGAPVAFEKRRPRGVTETAAARADSAESVKTLLSQE